MNLPNVCEKHRHKYGDFFRALHGLCESGEAAQDKSGVRNPESDEPARGRNLRLPAPAAGTCAYPRPRPELAPTRARGRNSRLPAARGRNSRRFRAYLRLPAPAAETCADFAPTRRPRPELAPTRARGRNSRLPAARGRNSRGFRAYQAPTRANHAPISHRAYPPTPTETRADFVPSLPAPAAETRADFAPTRARGRNLRRFRAEPARARRKQQAPLLPLGKAAL